ncbi:MAG TPA: magnesium/cobalt transporter CorA [Geminicoccaceae bacterium]|nr:magnesium/cobalt transporter CorA [Geminicoccaceae bacterium]
MSGRLRKHGRFRRLAHRPPAGSPPGTLVSPAAEAVPTTIRAITYGPERLAEQTLAAVADLDRLEPEGLVTWIDVQGLGSLDLLRALGQRLGLHALTLADIVHVNQRAKLETYESHLFIVVRMPHLDDRLWTEQLSLIVGDGLVVTFQERAGDCFDPVRERLRQSKGRLRGQGADYLAYALLDALIDSYFPLLERYGEALDVMEQQVVEAPAADHITRIHGLKRDMLELRRALWPMRELMSQLLREDVAFIGAGTRPFLRDCADHVFQLMDVVEIDREVASSLIDLHLSSVSMRMNEIMKVLTIIATIFIPLGFIAGVYGMNFDRAASPFNMPELGWYLGYPFALALMLAVALGLLAYFRRKGWLGARNRPEPPGPKAG